MSTPEEELKARLEAEAQKVIAELLANKKGPGEITLSEIEHVVQRAGQAFEQALTTELIRVSPAQIESDWPVCASCGKRLKTKGKRKRRLATLTGETTLEREYYYCPTCRTGLFPPGLPLGTERKRV